MEASACRMYIKNLDVLKYQNCQQNENGTIRLPKVQNGSNGLPKVQTFRMCLTFG
jgi:hypothetical protein